MKLDRSQNTKFQTIDFGSIGFQGADVIRRRKASGAGIIILNSVIPEGLRIQFDGNKQYFYPVPRKPIFFRFYNDIELHVPSMFGGNGVFSQIVSPSIKILVFDSEKSFFLNPINYESSFRFDFNLGVGVTLLQFQKAVGWNLVRLSVKGVGAGLVKCYKVRAIGGIDSSIAVGASVGSTCLGYLTVATGTEHEGDYLDVTLPYNLLNIEEEYVSGDNTHYLTVDFFAAE